MNNYINDDPIINIDDDKLNRSSYAKQLALALSQIDAKNGFCVGVYGKWGSGKTSLINMALSIIETMDKSSRIIRFNPWNFQNSEQLLKQFFAVMIKNFKGEKDEKINEVGDAITNYAELLDLLPFDGVKVAGKTLGCAVKKLSVSSNDINTQKDKIAQALSKENRKTFVIIDDIDRLANEEIECIFKLVNSVAKLPNIVYILVFDKEIVTRAIKGIQDCNGDEYLEKIIQLPIEIPQAKESDLWGILFNNLDIILKEHNFSYDINYWRDVFNEIVKQCIFSIRDINRMCNLLVFKLSIIGNDVDFCDLVALTAIECKYFDLYKWIRENKGRLVGSLETSLKRIGKDEKQICEENNSSLKQINSNRFELYKSFIMILFPYCKFDNYSYRGDSSSETLKNSRVGNENYYNNYFVLSLDNNAISNKEFNDAIYEYDVETLVEFLKSIDKKNKTLFFLRKMHAIEDELPKERVLILIKALVQISGSFVSKEEGLFGFSANWISEGEIVELIDKLETEDKKKNAIIDIIDKCDNKSIETISYVLNSIELAHGRFLDKSNQRGKKIISLDSLLECESTYIKKVKEICTDSNLLINSRNHYLTLHLLDCINHDYYEKYIDKLLIDDLNKIRYLCMFSSEWKSSNGSEWEYNNGYENKLSKEDALDCIKSCINNGTLMQLDVDDAERAIAFVLLNENKTDELGRVTNNEISNYINDMYKNEA